MLPGVSGVEYQHPVAVSVMVGARQCERTKSCQSTVQSYPG